MSKHGSTSCVSIEDLTVTVSGMNLQVVLVHTPEWNAYISLSPVPITSSCANEKHTMSWLNEVERDIKLRYVVDFFDKFFFIFHSLFSFFAIHFLQHC